MSETLPLTAPAWVAVDHGWERDVDGTYSRALTSARSEIAAAASGQPDLRVWLELVQSDSRDEDREIVVAAQHDDGLHEVVVMGVDDAHALAATLTSLLDLLEP